MEDSIFTKIIKGEISAHKVFENDHVIAVLDIHPIRPGHTLVIPKQQVDHFEELDEQVYQEVFKAVKEVAKRLKQVLGAKRACLRVEGFDIPHVHVHVIPCNLPEDFYNEHRNEIEPDHDSLAKVAEKLRFEG